MEGSSPLLANKNFWFNDPNFKERVEMGWIKVPTLQPNIVPFDRAMLKDLKDPTARQKAPTPERESREKSSELGLAD